MAIQSIVKEIRRKNSGGFDAPVNIGAEQKFVSALLNSHNNNLEEQSLIGNDCSVVIWEDSTINARRITRKFFDDNLSTVSSNGYYILFTIDYTNSPATDEFFFDGMELKLPEYGTGKASFVLGAGYDILTGDDPEIYVYDTAGGTLEITPTFKIIREDILCLRTDLTDTSNVQISSDILISKKVTSQRIDSSDTTYITQKITNYL